MRPEGFPPQPKPNVKYWYSEGEVCEAYLPFVQWFIAYYLLDPKLAGNAHLQEDCEGEALFEMVKLVQTYFREFRKIDVRFEHCLRIISRRAIVSVYRRELRQRGESTVNVKISPAIPDPRPEIDPFEVGLETVILKACHDDIDYAIVSGMLTNKSQTTIARESGTTRRIIGIKLQRLRKRISQIHERYR